METRIKNFEDLIVWQKAHALMVAIYDFTNFFPADEKFNRASQLKRSASSISANIAEGFGRYNYQENIQFCRQARGSLEETINHIIAARDLNHAPINKCVELINICNEVRKLLNGYIKATKDLKIKNSRVSIS